MRPPSPGGWVGVPSAAPIRRVLRRRSVRPRTGQQPVVRAPEPDPTSLPPAAPEREPDCSFCRLLDELSAGCRVAREPRAAALQPLAADALAPGHVVVASEQHISGMPEASPEDLTATTLLAQRISRGMREALGATGVNLLHSSGTDAGQEVAHLHLHLVPRWEGDGLRAWPSSRSTHRAPEDWQERLRRSLAG